MTERQPATHRLWSALRWPVAAMGCTAVLRLRHLKTAERNS